MPSSNDLDLSAELRLIPLFADVAKEALAEIIHAASQKRAHAGTSLIEQGIASPHLVILVRGAAKSVRTVVAGAPSGTPGAPNLHASGSGGSSAPPPPPSAPAGAAPASVPNLSAAGSGIESTIVLDVMRAPCIAFDASVLDGQPAAASVVTLRSSHVALVERRHLARLTAAHPSLARALLMRAAQELRGRVRRIDEIVVGPVDERVKHLLDSLAQEHGTPLGQGRFIAIPLRRRDLANMVNATTETVSRLLAKLEREGLARSTRDGIWWRSATAGALAPSGSSASKDKSRPPSSPPDTASAPANAHGNVGAAATPDAGSLPRDGGATNAR